MGRKIVKGTQNILSSCGIDVSEGGAIAGLVTVLVFLSVVLATGIRYLVREDTSATIEITMLQNAADFCARELCGKRHEGGLVYSLVSNAQSIIDTRGGFCGDPYQACIRFVEKSAGSAPSVVLSSANCAGGLAPVGAGTYVGEWVNLMHPGGRDYYSVVQIYRTDGTVTTPRVSTTDDCIVDPPPPLS